MDILLDTNVLLWVIGKSEVLKNETKIKGTEIIIAINVPDILEKKTETRLIIVFTLYTHLK